MAGIVRALEILQMARYAGAGAEVVVIVGVALFAGERRMRSGQRKTELAVIEPCRSRVQPRIEAVALLAVGAENAPELHVAGIVRPGIVLLVAGITLRGKSLELAHGRTLVTSLAVQRRVRSQQREAIIVVLDCLDGDVPSPYRVALLAVVAELPAMDISVTFAAARTDIGEHHLGVALNTGHVLVHAAQRIPCLIVIELGQGANGFPCRRGMTVGTRHGQRRTVRAACGVVGSRGPLTGGRGPGRHRHRHPQYELH